jgi:hypothetical protein
MIAQYSKVWTNIHTLSGIRTHDPSIQAANIHAFGRAATVTSTVHPNSSSFCLPFTSFGLCDLTVQPSTPQDFVITFKGTGDEQNE